MFANIVKEKRSERDLSQRQLGDLVGVTQQAVGRWETGQAFPDTATLLKLADLFNLSVDTLLGRSSQPAPVKCGSITPQLAQEDMELLEMVRKLKNLPDKDRKEVESYIKYKEQTSSVSTDEQAAAMGK